MPSYLPRWRIKVPKPTTARMPLDFRTFVRFPCFRPFPKYNTSDVICRDFAQTTHFIGLKKSQKTWKMRLWRAFKCFQTSLIRSLHLHILKEHKHNGANTVTVPQTCFQTTVILGRQAAFRTRDACCGRVLERVPRRQWYTRQSSPVYPW